VLLTSGSIANPAVTDLSRTADRLTDR